MATKALKNTVGLKELRQNMEAYITRVERGESITVLRRSAPIFTLTPVDDEQAQWDVVADFTTIHPEGVSGKEILARLKRIHG